MNSNFSEHELWIQPFANVFLGLDRAGLIRRILGRCESLLDVPAATITEMTWEDFIRQYAAGSAQTGLHYAWLAITQRCVAPAHWPMFLPFKPGIVARLRPVESDTPVVFAVHLAVSSEHKLDMLLGENTLETAQRLTALSQHVFRGADGPLTDLQVKDISSILNSAEYLQQLLEATHAKIVRPLVAAPEPHSIKTLFTFNENDFSDRRTVTHRLSIHAELPDQLVYCQADLRDLVQRILQQLVAYITAESTVTLTSRENGDTVWIEVHFHSVESEIRVEHMIRPLEFLDPARFNRAHIIERLVTAAQAYLGPVNGQVWAEPVSAPGATARIVLVLPRWSGDV